MNNTEKSATINRLGGTRKPNPGSILRDDQGNLLKFKFPDAVMFAICQKCGSLFEANKMQADDFIFFANTDSEIDETDCPQHLLEKNCNYEGYYIEIENCVNCDDEAEEFRTWIKKIPDRE